MLFDILEVNIRDSDGDRISTLFIYELNCSYRNFSLHSKVQSEKLNTTAIKRSYYNIWK